MNFTRTIEGAYSKIKYSLSKSQISCLIFGLIAAVVAHGYTFFNRLSYHDNSASLFSLGATFESGRWFLGIISKLQLFTTKTFSVPVFNGILSVVIILISAMLMIDILGVKKQATGAFVGVIAVVYPVVTSIFSFMFTSWPYFVGLLFAVLSAYFAIKKGGISGYVIAVLFLACSLGIYQAFFAVTIALFLIVLLMELLSARVTTFIDFFKQGIAKVVVLGAGLCLWAVLRKLFMTLLGIEAVAYKGMDDGYELSKFFGRLVVLFKSFFGFYQEGINSLRYLRLLTMMIFVVTIIQLIVITVKRVHKASLLIGELVVLVLLPIGMNIVYLLSTSDAFRVDTLMLYGDIFVLIVPVILIEELETLTIKNGIINSVISVVTWCQIAALLVISVGYIYLDNAAYLKADLAVEQARAYYTQLVANIKSAPGFSDDMDIIMVGWDELDDGTFASCDSVEALDAVALEKFPNYTDIVTYSGSISFMREHLAFGNEKLVIDHGEVAAEPAVEKMPCYPNDGSIAVVQDRLIVKLGK